ncbi:MAG: restriction endonuclease subunit S, partial [bacterium]
MAGEWSLRRFGDLYSEPSRNGLTKPMRVRGSGIKLVNMGEIFAHDRLIDVACDRAPLSSEETKVFLLEPGDLLFARQSLVLSGAGKCSIFIDDHEPATFESHIIRVRLDLALAEPLYYYYMFRGHYGRCLIKTIVEQGAGASGIRGTDLRELLVPAPALSEQRAIAHILGTLDDKIELNRRMNETLEAMARALFKSWFVDFDPARAKMEGRWRRGQSLPGLPAHLYDLFPDRFVNSELGEIPEGWEVGALGCTLQLRLERSEPSPETKAIPYVPIDCISPKSLFLTTSKSGAEAQSSLTRFYKGDLLFGAMRPYFHKVCIAPFGGTTRTTAFVLFPKETVDFSFATLLLHHSDTIDYATRHST